MHADCIKEGSTKLAISRRYVNNELIFVVVYL